MHEKDVKIEKPESCDLKIIEIVSPQSVLLYSIEYNPVMTVLELKEEIIKQQLEQKGKEVKVLHTIETIDLRSHIKYFDHELNNDFSIARYYDDLIVGTHTESRKIFLYEMDEVPTKKIYDSQQQKNQEVKIRIKNLVPNKEKGESPTSEITISIHSSVEELYEMVAEQVLLPISAEQGKPRYNINDFRLTYQEYDTGKDKIYFTKGKVLDYFIYQNSHSIGGFYFEIDWDKEKWPPEAQEALSKLSFDDLNNAQESDKNLIEMITQQQVQIGTLEKELKEARETLLSSMVIGAITGLVAGGAVFGILYGTTILQDSVLQVYEAAIISAVSAAILGAVVAGIYHISQQK